MVLLVLVMSSCMMRTASVMLAAMRIAFFVSVHLAIRLVMVTTMVTATTVTVTCSEPTTLL